MATSKELPEALRPYERCLAEGPAVLNDAELLAVILRTGSVGENSLALAARLLSPGGLQELVERSTAQLMKIRGVGKVKAVQLQCIGELGKRLSRRHSSQISFEDPAEVAGYYMDMLTRERQEQVILVMLNGRGSLIRDLMLTKGTVNRSLLSAREVFVEAFRYEAVKLILLHNHPGGDPEPSEDDLLVTQTIAEAGRMLSVPLIDHIIIGGNTFVSLRERGWIT